MCESPAIEPVRVVVENVSAGYGSRTVVKDVSVSFSGVGVHTIIGPNASGKSTLLRVISGVLEPLQGDVLINDVSIYKNREVRRAIGYLPADLGLIPKLTLYENIKLFLELFGFDRSYMSERLAFLEKFLQIGDILHLRVDNMSTGQRVRAGLARTLAHDPKVIILDEPTRGLDVFFARQVRDLLRSVAKDRMVIMTSHIMYEVLELGGHIVVIRGGNVIFDGSVTELRRIFTDKPVRVFLRTSTDVSDVLSSLGLEYEKRGYGDYAVRLPNLGYAPGLIRELAQHTNILEFREDIDELVGSIYMR